MTTAPASTCPNYRPAERDVPDDVLQLMWEYFEFTA